MPIRAGFHPHFEVHSFDVFDQRWLRSLSHQWFLTNSGGEFRSGASAVYRWFLAKPAEELSALIGVDREVLFLMAPYANFEPRTLSAFDEIESTFEALRIDSTIRIIISDAENADEKVNDILRASPEQPTSIAIYRPNLSATNAAQAVWQAIRVSFRVRDLFGHTAPLDSDLYFFGRQKIIQDIVGTFEDRKISGVFGVRRSGKTSVLNGVRRVLSKRASTLVQIDCQNPSFYLQKWPQALAFVCLRIRQAINMSTKGFQIESFSESNAPLIFEETIADAYAHNQRRPLLLAFDEIERVSPGTADDPSWRSGEEFIPFWRTVRATAQGAHRSKFSLLIVGTSPIIFEAVKINGLDNPLYAISHPFYLEPFDLQTTSEMIAVIGRAVGLRFNDSVEARIHLDAGGIPFLTRQICSAIHRQEGGNRPATVNLASYGHASRTFRETSDQVVEQMVGIIRDLYPLEYDLLRALAANDRETFTAYASDEPTSVSHLVGYGLVERHGNNYEFRIDAVRDYLLRKTAARKERPSPEERWQEVSSRRNNLEPKLRRGIANALIFTRGKSKAAESLLAAIPTARRQQMPSDLLAILRAGQDGGTFFLDLRNVIDREWNDLQNLFDEEKARILYRLEEVNRLRIDAHAKEIRDEDFQILRACFDALERQLADV